MSQQEDAKDDLELYSKMMTAGNVKRCVYIEQQWDCHGLPPSMVSSVLAMVADGKTLDDALDAVEGKK